MEKIKRFAYGAILIAVISIAAACGRTNNNSATGTSSAGGIQTSAGTASDTEGSQNGSTAGNKTDSSGSGLDSTSPGTASSSAGTNGDGESGGILQDMVDDVKDGIDDMTGTSGGNETNGDGLNGNRASGNGANGTGTGMGAAGGAAGQ